MNMKHTLLILLLSTVAACGTTTQRLGVDLYRIKPCVSHEETLECSRIARKLCPNGYYILNRADEHFNTMQIITCVDD